MSRRQTAFVAELRAVEAELAAARAAAAKAGGSEEAETASALPREDSPSLAAKNEQQSQSTPVAAGCPLSDDHYEVLGIDRKASAGEIKAAFRQLALMYHPDKNAAGGAAFVKVTEAFEALSDPQKRREYDKKSRAGPPARDRWLSPRRFQPQQSCRPTAMGREGGSVYDESFARRSRDHGVHLSSPSTKEFGSEGREQALEAKCAALTTSLRQACAERDTARAERDEARTADARHQAEAVAHAARMQGAAENAERQAQGLQEIKIMLERQVADGARRMSELLQTREARTHATSKLESELGVARQQLNVLQSEMRALSRKHDAALEEGAALKQHNGIVLQELQTVKGEKDALEMQVRKLELEMQEKAKDNARLSEQWDQQRAQQQDDAHTQLEERDQQRELLQQLHHHEKSARQWQGMFDSVSGVLEQERRQRAANDANVSDQLRRLEGKHKAVLYEMVSMRDKHAAELQTLRIQIQRLSADLETAQKWDGDAEERQVSGSGGGMASPALVSQLC